MAHGQSQDVHCIFMQTALLADRMNLSCSLTARNHGTRLDQQVESQVAKVYHHGGQRSAHGHMAAVLHVRTVHHRGLARLNSEDIKRDTLLEEQGSPDILLAGMHGTS